MTCRKLLTQAIKLLISRSANNRRQQVLIRIEEAVQTVGNMSQHRSRIPLILGASDHVVGSTRKKFFDAFFEQSRRESFFGISLSRGNKWPSAMLGHCWRQVRRWRCHLPINFMTSTLNRSLRSFLAQRRSLRVLLPSSSDVSSFRGVYFSCFSRSTWARRKKKGIACGLIVELDNNENKSVAPTEKEIIFLWVPRKENSETEKSWKWKASCKATK